MGLINCPECGKEVSDKANICIHCGFPLQEYLLEMKKKEGEKEKEAEKREAEENKYICSYCGFKNPVGEDYCLKCDMRITEYVEKTNDGIENNYDENEQQEVPISPYTICPNCGKYNDSDTYKCVRCGHKYSIAEYNVIYPEEKFDGVYRYSPFGGIKEVYCPRCHSSNCSHYQEQKYIPGKTKTRYTVNLNPLKPFTLINKKEKVKRKEEIKTINRFVCNSCGKIFD